MNTTTTEGQSPGRSRWRGFLDYLNAACAISSWALYGPRTWEIDETARLALAQLRRHETETSPADRGRVAAPATSGGLVACCCSCGAGG